MVMMMMEWPKFSYLKNFPNKKDLVYVRDVF